MVEQDERELLAALRGYLEELKESGVDEIPFGDAAPAAEAPKASGPEKANVPSQTPEEPVLRCSGSTGARLLFVWGGPELTQRSRELLNRLIAAMKVTGDEVYLLNFEPGACAAEVLREALLERVASVGPEVVVTLGEDAARIITRKADPIAQLGGRLLKFGKMQLLVTLHPDQLVADQGLKAQVWQDMKLVMTRLGKS